MQAAWPDLALATIAVPRTSVECTSPPALPQLGEQLPGGPIYRFPCGCPPGWLGLQGVLPAPLPSSASKGTACQRDKPEKKPTKKTKKLLSCRSACPAGVRSDDTSRPAAQIESRTTLLQR